MRRFLRRALLAASAVAALGAGWYFLAPPQLGGSTSYVVVVGSSMEPHLQRGDLVVLRRRADYRVGQIVAYRNSQIRQRVLHRIVDRRGERFLFKGDHNDFLDPVRPAQTDLIGAQWLRLPGVGAQLQRLREPWNAALAAGTLLLLLMAGGGESPPARRRRDPRRSPKREPERALSAAGQMAHFSLTFAVAALLAFLALGLVAFTRPTVASAPLESLYAQAGRFDYTAPAPAGPVYQDGRVHTGEPVFRRVVSSVDVRFAYRVQARRTAETFGTASLEAELTDGRGWRHRLLLQPARAFQGDHTTVAGTLSLRRLEHLIASFEALTGAHNELYEVALTPRIALHGAIGGNAVEDTFGPSLRFALDKVGLRVAAASSSGGPENTLTRSKPGTGSLSAPAELSVLHIGVRVATTRWIAVAGAFAALTALALGGLLLLLSGRGDETARIETRYGDWLVPAAPLRREAGVMREVRSFEALFRLAERYDRLILHEQDGYRHAYLVEENGLVYRYEPDADGLAPDEEQTWPMRPVVLR